jgi:hypothetical protein
MNRKNFAQALIVLLLFMSCSKQEQMNPTTSIAEKDFTACTGSCDDLTQEPYHFICVLPSETSTGIYADYNAPHMVSTPTVASNGKLVVFLVGTNIEPNSCSKFYKKANDMGYHVIALSYVNAATISKPMRKRQYKFVRGFLSGSFLRKECCQFYNDGCKQ